MRKSVLLVILIAACHAFYTKSDGVVELTDLNFDSKVLKSDAFWIVEFYAPYCGHCKNLIPEYKKAASLLKGIAHVGAVDATVHNQVPGEYAIQGYPTIKIFGGDKKNPIEYSGPRTAKGIAEAVKKEISKLLEQRLLGTGSKKQEKKGSKKGGEVVVLTESNFAKLVLNSKDPWMVEFYAPWCGHCQKLEPEWKKAAAKMGGRVKFGALDATAHQTMAQEFGIRGFPTIKFFAPGSSAKDAEDYMGGRTSGDLVSFAEAKFESVAPPPEVIEATGKETVQETCKNKQLCIFVFLPSIYDCQSKCRNERIAMINELAEMFKSRQWGWLWMEAGAQKDIEDAFRLGDSGYPVLTAMSPSKMKYATQIGSFSVPAIKEFLNSVNYGKSRVHSVEASKLENNFLKVSEIQPWDGKDKELPVIEEIDLSDVELEEEFVKTEF